MPLFVEGKLQPGRVGIKLADAVDIETTGSSDVQADLNIGKIQSQVINATDATTFASSLSGVTVVKGHRFRVGTAGEPFTGETVSAEIGDIMMATVDSPSLTDVTNWAIIRRSAGLPVDPIGAAFLNQVSESNGDYSLANPVKVGSLNLSDELEARVAQHSTTSLSAAMADLQRHLTINHIGGTWREASNPTPHRASSIARRFSAYFEENRTGATPETGNHFSDLVDPTITLTTPSTNGGNYFFANPSDSSNLLFPGKKSYFIGTLDVSGSPLTNDSHVLMGFSHHINQAITGDTPILKFGTRVLLGVDASGLYALRGNQDGAQITTSFDQRLTESETDTNTIQYLRGVGAQSVTWFVPDTITFPETFTIRFKLVNSSGTGARTEEEYTIVNRDVTQAQTSHVVAMNLPTTGTQDETILLSYDHTTNLLTVATAGISTNGTADVSQLGMEVTFNDSAQVNSSTTSSKVRFGEQDEQVGRTIDIVLLIETTNPFETSADKFLTLKAVVNGRQENNVNLLFRESAYDFSNMQIGPDTATNKIAFSQIQLYRWDDGGEPLDAPTHSELYAFYTHRENYFGLFESSETDKRIYNILGEVSTQDRDGDTIRLNRKIVEAGNFISGSSITASLPIPHSLSDFLFMEVSFHTGIGAATDNDNRDYTQMCFVDAVINANESTVILGGAGRGADNYGIEVTKPASGSAITIALRIINLNDAGGATLPTGSLITHVRFY